MDREKLKRRLQRLISKTYLKNTLTKIVTYILLIDLSFVFLLPFIYMVVTSFMTDANLSDVSIKWVPTSLYLENFRRAFRALSYNRHLINSLIMIFFCTAGHVFSDSLAGYALAKYQFRGAKLFFVIVVLSMVVPMQIIIIPTYLQFYRLGFTGTYLPMIIPAFLGYGLKGGMFIFLYRQYFLGIPKEYIEASRIDGCGFLSSFYRIVFPTATTPTLVTCVLSIIWHWNDYFEATFYVRSQKWQVLTQRLPMIYNEFKSINVPDPVTKMPLRIYNEAVFMAATFLVILPILILYLILQKSFIEGIERTGHVE